MLLALQVAYSHTPKSIFVTKLFISTTPKQVHNQLFCIQSIILNTLF